MSNWIMSKLPIKAVTVNTARYEVMHDGVMRIVITQYGDNPLDKRVMVFDRLGIPLAVSLGQPISVEFFRNKDELDYYRAALARHLRFCLVVSIDGVPHTYWCRVGHPLDELESLNVDKIGRELIAYYQASGDLPKDLSFEHLEYFFTEETRDAYLTLDGINV